MGNPLPIVVTPPFSLWLLCKKIFLFDIMIVEIFLKIVINQYDICLITIRPRFFTLHSDTKVAPLYTVESACSNFFLMF